MTELPYQVNKARLLERIADLVRDKEIEGISELRDESDKDGLRVVIELKRGENSELVLNQLFKLTPMESVFGVNMVALLDGQPKLLSLKEMLDAFLRHRREVVTRRTIYDLRKARERAHILEGPRRRAREHRRGHRADQGLAVAAGGAGRAAGADLGPGRGARDAGARRQRADASRRHRGRARPARRRLPAVRGPGPGDPRPAAAPPDRARAGQDRHRVHRAARADPRPRRDPRAAGPPARGHPRAS